jgi:hypothetical protein
MGEMGDARSVPAPAACAKPARDVDDLLRRANEHPLGLDFLESGSLDAVAATFRVHAFVVDAARDVLAAPGAPAPRAAMAARR